MRTSEGRKKCNNQALIMVLEPLRKEWYEDEESRVREEEDRERERKKEIDEMWDVL